ncbi:MAG: hypothetical protein Q4G43_10310 [Mobilicoccus sp.]|nr:hypothetical protein [Mobilicoccus sp.]
MEAEFDRVVTASDTYRVGDAYVSMVHLDPVNERLLVGIDGGTHSEQVQLARQFRADTNVPTEFFTASAGA